MVCCNMPDIYECIKSAPSRQSTEHLLSKHSYLNCGHSSFEVCTNTASEDFQLMKKV